MYHCFKKVFVYFHIKIRFLFGLLCYYSHCAKSLVVSLVFIYFHHSSCATQRIKYPFSVNSLFSLSDIEPVLRISRMCIPDVSRYYFVPIVCPIDFKYPIKNSRTRLIRNKIIQKTLFEVFPHSIHFIHLWQSSYPAVTMVSMNCIPRTPSFTFGKSVQRGSGCSPAIFACTVLAKFR